MLRSVEHMKKLAIVATDGPIGSLDDAYFDDERWAIRYLVAEPDRHEASVDRRSRPRS